MLVTMRSSRQRDCYAGFVQLTARELAVLRMIAGGRTNAQIAAELYLSNQSVGRCIGTLLLRTHADNRAELVARAYVEGVLDHAEWPPKLTGEDHLAVLGGSEDVPRIDGRTAMS